jgi:hypothetical protein
MAQGSTNFEATVSVQHAQPTVLGRPGQSLLERIGNTPLLRFDQFCFDSINSVPSCLTSHFWARPNGTTPAAR